jgi:hypothetical protein
MKRSFRVSTRADIRLGLTLATEQWLGSLSGVGADVRDMDTTDSS